MIHSLNDRPPFFDYHRFTFSPAKMELAELDTESSRLAKRNNLEKFSFENILEKCASLDDFEKEVDKTWKKSGNGKIIRAGFQETIANMRKCDDTQR